MSRAFTLTTMQVARRFVPARQMKFIQELMLGEEAQFFRDALVKLEDAWNALPWVGADGGDKAIAGIHLFAPAADWWIVERPTVGTDPAFGIADLGFREIGYFSLPEILRLPGVEVDLHWQPKTVAEIMAEAKAGAW